MSRVQETIALAMHDETIPVPIIEQDLAHTGADVAKAVTPDRGELETGLLDEAKSSDTARSSVVVPLFGRTMPVPSGLEADLEGRTAVPKATAAAIIAEDQQVRSFGLFAGVPMGLFRATIEGRLLASNPAFDELIGNDEGQDLSMFRLSDLYVDGDEYRRWQSAMESDGIVRAMEVRMRRCDGAFIWVRQTAQVVRDADGCVLHLEGTLEDVTDHKLAELELERKVAELEHALETMKLLSGLIPICACCKKVKDEDGEWNDVETYIEERTEAAFTHSICSDCGQELYGPVWDRVTAQMEKSSRTDK